MDMKSQIMSTDCVLISSGLWRWISERQHCRSSILKDEQFSTLSLTILPHIIWFLSPCNMPDVIFGDETEGSVGHRSCLLVVHTPGKQTDRYIKPVQCEGGLKCGPNNTRVFLQYHRSLTKRTSKRAGF